MPRSPVDVNRISVTALRKIQQNQHLARQPLVAWRRTLWRVNLR